MMADWQKQADKVTTFQLNGGAGFHLALAVVEDAAGFDVVQQPLTPSVLLSGVESGEKARRLALERLAHDLAAWQTEIADAILHSIPKVERLLHITDVLRFVYLTRIPTPQTVAHLWHRAEYTTRTCCNKPLGTHWMVVPESEARPQTVAEVLLA
jgi:hypothetical protein